MKKLLLATSALVVIATAHPARAADQSPAPRLPTKAPIVPPAPIYNWTGCYIGAQGGGGAVSDPFVGDRLNGNFLHGGGGFGGGQIGCNYQSGNFVFGLEGEAWSGLTNPDHAVETTSAFTLNFIDRNRWSADVAVRAGLAFDRALLYGKAGIAQGRFAFSVANSGGGFANGASTLTGTLLGVGLEYGLAPNWSAKLEYDHIEYAGRTVHFETSGGPSDQTEFASVNLVKAGINYRFGGPSLPLASDGATAHASLYKALPFKAPAAASFSWTGCYAGVHGGGGWMRDSFISDASGSSGGGGFAGGQLGCNVQAGVIVWGIEGEAAWSGLTDHLNRGFAVDVTTHNRWSADIAARAGLAVDRTLVYGKAGVAAGHFAFSADLAPDVENGSATLAGLLLGAGVEYALTQNWSVKLEYNHVDYFGRNVAFIDSFSGPFTVTEAATTDVVKLGVNYRFGNGPFGDAPFAPAADRTTTGPAIFKAPAYKTPAVALANWTGCYAGVHGGGGILADTGLGSNDEFPVPISSGGFAGGQLGCDVQTGALVWGLEGEAAWSRIINRDSDSSQLFESSANLVWSADGAVRAGVAIDRGLFYGKAGIAAGRFKFSSTDNGDFESGASTLTGLLLGGGIEYALAPNWSVLLEYDRIAYAGRVVHVDASGPFDTPFDQTLSATVNEAKAGINYRFGGAPLSLAASASQRLLPPPATDWTGCYAGIHAGGGILDDTFVSLVGFTAVAGGGAVAGGQAGCNVQTGVMVFGLETEAAWSDVVNRFSFSQGGNIADVSDRNRWSADVAARGGIAFDRALLYGKAGVAAGRFAFFESDNAGGFLQGGTTLTGLLLGLGVEYTFASNWSAKLEYDHVGYLSRNVDLGPQLTNNESATTNTVKAGINYKFYGPSGFFGPSAVVVARD